MTREMKNSGIPWIGEIPEGWSSIKLLYVLRAHITDGPHETPNLIDEGIPFISIDSLNDSDTIDFSNVRKFISYDDYLRYNIKSNIEKDDILFTKAATIGKTAIVKDEIFMVWSPLAIIKANHSIVCNKYLYHILNTDNLIKDVILHGSNNTQINVGMRELEAAIIPFPPLAEQQRIAEFLDRKCAEVDEMIALQEQIIEELKAYKQSVITEAVTKGLNPAAPMRDSGIEWIGSIPEHWEVKRLKNIFRLKTGTTPDGFDIVNEDSEIIPWFTPSDISDDCCELHQSERKLYKSEVGEIELFPKGSLMFVGIGASAGKLGYSHISGYSNQQITALIPDNCNGKYYYYFLIADRKRLRDNAFFTTLPIINNGYLSQNKVVYPPTTEQQAITDYLDEKCADIDSLIQTKQSKIDSLKEYKKSIIYEYVTGKREVEL